MKASSLTILGSIIVTLLITTGYTFALSTDVTIRVCTGSSCLGKCRGAFNPKTALEDHIKTKGEDDEPNVAVKIEEVFCMNQCKRGPNMRIIRDGNVITFDDNTIMNDVELKRKSFQGVRSNERVAMVWGLTEGLVNGSVVGTEAGPSTKLTDILPQT